MAVNKAKLIETANTDALRAQKRIHFQSKEVSLAQGALDRATARLAKADEKVAKYQKDLTEAVEVLEMLNAPVPEYVPVDGDETDSDDVTEEVTDEAEEDSEETESDEDVAEDSDELEDVRV